MNRLLASLAITLVVAVSATTGQAASRQAPVQTVLELDRVATFAKMLERELAARGARIAIVSRVGRPQGELPPGFRYTHTGFAVYSEITTSDGRTVPGYAMYNLYQDAERLDASNLVTDYPVDFFGGVFELRSGVIIPTPQLQQRLLRVLGSHTYRDLHVADYSSVANPFDARFQNCTEFILDVLNAAVYETDDMALLKSNARAYFDAQPVKVGRLKARIASWRNDDITLKDQKGGKIETATFTTIAQYMDKYGLSQAQFELAEGVDGDLASVSFSRASG
ncbi:MAG: DUF2145 domain-containing protein [Gammaproteobacteria bacterium]|nr:DUF2145 domain-containing protein [Gammaproteobacteria bacterium]